VTEWASVPIAIGSGDLKNFVVELRPAATVTIRIPPVGETARAAALMSLSLTPAAGVTGTVAISGVRRTRGPLYVSRCGAGRSYWIGISNLPAPWIVRDATAAGHDVLDQPLSVAANDAATEVVLNLTDRPSFIAGTFTDASGRAATDYTVIVFSADRRHWRAGSRQITAVRPATDGRFTTAALPRGRIPARGRLGCRTQ
jgi:hypothetical protein